MDLLLRGRIKAMDISKALLEIALDKAKAIREDALRLVEMAMCSCAVGGVGKVGIVHNVAGSGKLLAKREKLC